MKQRQGKTNRYFNLLKRLDYPKYEAEVSAACASHVAQKKMGQSAVTLSSRPLHTLES